MYVLSERALQAKEGPTETEICAGVGIVNLAITVLYIAAYSAAGQFPKFVLGPIRDSGESSVGGVFGVWACLSVVLALHYYSFYCVIHSSSSVAAGVNKALQSVGVFVLSEVLFCHRDDAQCFTVFKGVACGCVTCGTVLFAYGSQLQKKAATEVTFDIAPDPQEMQESLLLDAGGK